MVFREKWGPLREGSVRKQMDGKSPGSQACAEHFLGNQLHREGLPDQINNEYSTIKAIHGRLLESSSPQTRTRSFPGQPAPTDPSLPLYRRERKRKDEDRWAMTKGMIVGCGSIPACFTSRAGRLSVGPSRRIGFPGPPRGREMAAAKVIGSAAGETQKIRTITDRVDPRSW